MFKNTIHQFVRILNRFHWLLLGLAAPFLVFPSPKRSLALIIIPFLWILYLISGRQDETDQPSTFNLQPSTEPIDRSGESDRFPITPLNLSLLVLTIMLLVSLWATYSMEQSLEKITGLVLGLAVYFAIVRESKKPKGWWWSLLAFLAGGLGWAALGFFGMDYQVRFSFLAPIISRIPILISSFPTLGTGLQHNAVGGTILWYLPLYCVLSVYLLKYKIEDIRYKIEKRVSGKTWVRFTQSRVAVWVSRFGLWLGTLFIGGVLVLTQSRGSYLAAGLTALIILFIVISKRWRWVLVGLVGLIAAAGIFFIFQSGGWEGIINQLGLTAEEGLSTRTLDPRLEIWSRSITGLQDFPITGMGMNTFREVVHLLYPLFTISPDLDIAHAHNEFLQVGLDLGIPGMIAFISINITSFWMLVKVWKAPSGNLDEASDLGNPILIKTLVLGLGGGLFAHLVFGMMDAITLGAKPGIFFWMLLGLISGLYNLTNADVKEVDQ